MESIMRKIVEYRVRPVTRYIVTRYESAENSGSVSTIGEFPNEPSANLIREVLERDTASLEDFDGEACAANTRALDAHPSMEA